MRELQMQRGSQHVLHSDRNKLNFSYAFSLPERNEISDMNMPTRSLVISEVSPNLIEKISKIK